MSKRGYIEERSIPEPMSGCWIWLLSTGSHGYGQAKLDGEIVTMHRVSFEAFVGPIPSGMLVQHSCDNRWCVAPHHLSIGTKATNNADMARKGRAASRLSPSDVRIIRARVAAGSTHQVAADAFGVSRSTVGRIVNGKHWRFVV